MGETPQAMPKEDASRTDGAAEESAREAYHGGTTPPQGGGRALGRKEPETSGEASDDRENVRQR